MTTYHPIIRDLLKLKDDGLTTKEISDTLKMGRNVVRIALHKMPDAYIDRWLCAENPSTPPEAVWCVVVPPENCPKPERTK